MNYKFLIFTAFLIFAVSCSSNSTANPNNQNANNSNANNSNSTPVASSSALVNSNAAKPAPTPIEVPVYDNAQAALDAGKKFFAEDEDESAIKALEQAVKLDAGMGEAYLYLGFVHDALDHDDESDKAYKDAVKTYLKFTAKNPKDAAAQYNLGRTYNKLNEDDKSEKALRQAIKLQADDSEYHRELGAVLIKLAKYAEAVKELKTALELDSQNTRAEELLERAEAGVERVKGAKAKNKELADKNKPDAPVSKPNTKKPKNSNSAAPPTVSPNKNSR